MHGKLNGQLGHGDACLELTWGMHLANALLVERRDVQRRCSAVQGAAAARNTPPGGW